MRREWSEDREHGSLDSNLNDLMELEREFKVTSFEIESIFFEESPGASVSGSIRVFDRDSIGRGFDSLVARTNLDDVKVLAHRRMLL